MKLTRNTDNEGKKRPICACGIQMTFVKFKGYYDKRKYWVCENPDCKTEDNFSPDLESIGAYA